MNGISFRQHDVCRYFTTLQLQINDKKKKTDGLMDTLEYALDMSSRKI